MPLTRINNNSLSNVTSAGIPQHDGAVIQTKQVKITGRQRFNTTTEGDVTGSEISITPSATTSDVLFIPSITMIANNPQGIRFNLMRKIGTGSYTQISTFGYYCDVSWNGTTVSWQYLDSPATTSQVSYKLRIDLQQVGDTYLNYANTDIWSTVDDGVSTVIVQEIAGS